MAQTAQQALEQAERRRTVAGLYIRRIPKGEIAQLVKVSKQTITRDVAYLLDLWNKELVRDPVAQRARTLASLQELEKNAAARYLATNSQGWWRNWLDAVLAISKFLGLDEPIQVDVHLDGDVNFTVEFETPDGRIIDASNWEVKALQAADDGDDEPDPNR